MLIKRAADIRSSEITDQRLYYSRREFLTQLTPRKRFAQPGEIADAVLYLSSHESRFIIGTDLVIDGGRIQL